MEAELAKSRAAALIVSHDRAFLERITGRCFWLAHRRVRTLELGFTEFETWADKVEAEEAEKLRRLEKAYRAGDVHLLSVDHRSAHPQRGTSPER